MIPTLILRLVKKTLTHSILPKAKLFKLGCFVGGVISRPWPIQQLFRCVLHLLWQWKVILVLYRRVISWSECTHSWMWTLHGSEFTIDSKFSLVPSCPIRPEFRRWAGWHLRSACQAASPSATLIRSHKGKLPSSSQAAYLQFSAGPHEAKYVAWQPAIALAWELDTAGSTLEAWPTRMPCQHSTCVLACVCFLLLKGLFCKPRFCSTDTVMLKNARRRYTMSRNWQSWPEFARWWLLHNSPAMERAAVWQWRSEVSRLWKGASRTYVFKKSSWNMFWSILAAISTI